MERRTFYLFIATCASLTIFVDSLQKYPYISDCIFYNCGRQKGTDNATFVCGPNGSFVSPSTEVKCRNYGGDWPGTIDFRDCQFTEITRDFFGPFPNMHTFIVSNVDLEKITVDTFKRATNITKLILTKNRLEEIPPLAFSNAQKLQSLGLSQNKIKRIDSLAFVGLKNLTSLDLSHNKVTRFEENVFKELSNLQYLNLSFNEIDGLDSNDLTLPNLLELDLAHNELTALNGHAFNQLSSLKQLNLSFNPIGQLDTETFELLINLEYLYLRRMNISSIAMGTFSHQQKLVSLDLSGNLLKTIEFKIFLPNLPDLIELRLSSNRLSDLSGFRSSLFPQLLSLDIQQNDFNCSYLGHFMETVDWHELHMPINPYLVDASKPNVRGINCKLTEHSQNGINAGAQNFVQSTDESHKISSQKVHDHTHHTIVLVLESMMCIIMLVLLVLFVILNREKIYNRFGRTATTRSTNELSSHNVAFSTTEPFFKD